MCKSSFLCSLSVTSNSLIMPMKMMRWAAPLQSAFLASVVKSRSDVLFDRRQQLCGGETKMDVEFAVEEFNVDAFCCL